MSVDTNILFRPRKCFGLQLSDPAVVLKKLQVGKCWTLKHSEDVHVKAHYAQREARESAETGRVWRPTRALRGLF